MALNVEMRHVLSSVAFRASVGVCEMKRRLGNPDITPESQKFCEERLTLKQGTILACAEELEHLIKG